MKNACIVGCGTIAPNHAKAIARAENANLYAVCDIKPERVEAYRSEYGAKGYTDFYEMLKDEQVDTVHICTPHYLHCDMILAALQAGKDVVCEKPVTMTREQFDTLLAAPGSERVAIVFQNRLEPCAQKLKSIITEGSLGNILCVRGIVTWCRKAAYYQDDWHGRWRTEGGGVLINQAIHTLDMLCYQAGPVESVNASISNFSLRDVIEVEDTASARLQFKSGATGIFFATNAYGTSDRPDIEVVFEHGTARYSGKKLFLGGELICEDTPPTTGKAYYGSGHDKLICDYYDRQKFFSLSDVENTMRTLFAIYESARTQKEIRI